MKICAPHLTGRLLRSLVIVLLMSFAPRWSLAEEPPVVLIISIDGLRPDVLLRAQAPVLKDLLQKGSFSFYARTTQIALTLPSHMSMLTGVSPDIHGVTWNDARPVVSERYPLVPTLFVYACLR
ncbi:MAG: hypothetical protein EBZ48_01480 [Proteobacteria bacterium]|nr:hypothetical protein [Pseudomonadota bacterium]